MQGTPIRRASGMLTMLWLVACGRSGDTPAPDSARTFTAAARGGRTYPGALTKPIDAYSGDELYELTSGLRYAGSHERARRCRGSAECDRMASVKRTLVQVSAVATQDSLGAGDLPEFGVVHVRAINRGDAEEARYGMRPGGTLRYYLIVQPDSAGAMRWRLEELQTASPRRHVQVAAGSVRGCGHRWKAGARADFKSCEQADRTDTVMTLPLALQTEFEAPIWFECDMGCCVSER